MGLIARLLETSATIILRKYISALTSSYVVVLPFKKNKLSKCAWKIKKKLIDDKKKFYVRLKFEMRQKKSAKSVINPQINSHRFRIRYKQHIPAGYIFYLLQRFVLPVKFYINIELYNIYLFVFFWKFLSIFGCFFSKFQMGTWEHTKASFRLQFFEIWVVVALSFVFGN
jgi:hypothetical protein